MKKILLALALAFTLGSMAVFGQIDSGGTGSGSSAVIGGPNDIWKRVGTVISPSVPGDTVNIPGLSSPLITKGDVWGYSTIDARIPIGADGLILTANSAQALGVEWGAVGTGDVTAAAVLGDNLLIRGDGAAKGIQNSGISIDDSDNMTGILALTATTINGTTYTGIDASEVAIALGGGSPTIDQIQEYLDNTGSSGFFLGGEITDGGAGTIDVAAGSGFIRTTNDDNAELQSFKWSASGGSLWQTTQLNMYM